MRRIFVTGFFICLFGYLQAQQPEESRYMLTNSRTMYGLSSVNLYDGYLSSVPYSGLGVRYDHESGRYLTNNTRVSRQQNLSLLAGLTVNDAATAGIEYAGIDYARGALYHFKPVYGAKFALGTTMGADLTMKINTRNINNVYNMDMSANIFLAGSVSYDMPVRGRIYRLKATARSPLLGCMFVPVRGASYYEMFTFDQYKDAVHFSSLHNKSGIVFNCFADIPFNCATVSIGLRAQNLRYAANDMVFYQNELSLIVGYSIDYLAFSGHRRQPARNMIRLDR